MSTKVEVKAPQVRDMFGSIASSYDLVNTVLSGGIHHLWRMALARSLPIGKELVALDLCSGTGALVPMLSKRYNHVVATDFCEPMLAISNKKYVKTDHVLGDALKLGFQDEAFDVITVAFGVRNFEDLSAGLTEIKRVVKPGGKVIIIEFGQPSNGVWKAIFDLYSRYILPTLGGLISGNRDAYTYLPKTSAVFPCGQAFLDIMERSGYSQLDSRALTGGIAYIYVATVSES